MHVQDGNDVLSSEDTEIAESDVVWGTKNNISNGRLFQNEDVFTFYVRWILERVVHSSLIFWILDNSWALDSDDISWISTNNVNSSAGIVFWGNHAI